MTDLTDGVLVTIDGRAALRFERRYPHAIERVWRAVTDPDEMASWFPARVVGERAVGAPLRFDDGTQREAAAADGEPARADGPMFSGTVVVCDPPHVFSFTWGGELLRIELRAADDGTVLEFTHHLGHRSTAARNGAGWNACLAGLDAALDPSGGSTAAGDWKDAYLAFVDGVGPGLGHVDADGSLVWERAIHLGPDRVQTAIGDEVASWSNGALLDDDIEWTIDAAPFGSIYSLRCHSVGRDAETAAQWHALLLQLDMWMAAGQVVPVDRERFVPAYRRLLSQQD